MAHYLQVSDGNIQKKFIVYHTIQNWEVELVTEFLNVLYFFGNETKVGQIVFGGCHPRGKSLKCDHFIKIYLLQLVLHFCGRLFGKSMFHRA